jgi:hypothetical protein
VNEAVEGLFTVRATRYRNIALLSLVTFVCFVTAVVKAVLHVACIAREGKKIVSVAAFVLTSPTDRVKFRSNLHLFFRSKTEKCLVCNQKGVLVFAEAKLREPPAHMKRALQRRNREGSSANSNGVNDGTLNVRKMRFESVAKWRTQHSTVCSGLWHWQLQSDVRGAPRTWSVEEWQEDGYCPLLDALQTKFMDQVDDATDSPGEEIVMPVGSRSKASKHVLGDPAVLRSLDAHQAQLFSDRWQQKHTKLGPRHVSDHFCIPDAITNALSDSTVYAPITTVDQELRWVEKDGEGETVQRKSSVRGATWGAHGPERLPPQPVRREWRHTH